MTDSLPGTKGWGTHLNLLANNSVRLQACLAQPPSKETPLVTDPRINCDYKTSAQTWPHSVSHEVIATAPHS